MDARATALSGHLCRRRWADAEESDLSDRLILMARHFWLTTLAIDHSLVMWYHVNRTSRLDYRKERGREREAHNMKGEWRRQLSDRSLALCTHSSIDSVVTHTTYTFCPWFPPLVRRSILLPSLPYSLFPSFETRHEAFIAHPLPPLVLLVAAVDVVVLLL